MTHTFRGEQRPGQSSIRSSGGLPVLDETYHHLVIADSTTADRLSILATTGVPVPGVTVSSWGAAICKHVDAVRRPEQILYWDITSEFSSDVDERQSSFNPRTDPQAWIPVYETKFERLQENVTKDAAGTAVANSAGQPFENGIIRARFIPIWEFFQFEADTVTDQDVIDRNEVVNSVTFQGRAAKTLLCNVMSSVIGYYYGERRRLTKYSLRYNVATWQHKRLDVGTVYLSAGEHLPYLDKSGTVMLGGLNGSGEKVTPGTAPSVLTFDMYTSVAFAAFLRT
jgi:hypothetical protein